jgi:hypothetical protein
MSTEHIQFDEDEKVLTQVRKHWFLLCTQFLGIIIVALFPLGAYLVLSPLTPLTPLLSKVPPPLLIALYSGWLILAWMGLFSIWTNYYLDVWTVTNKRLIIVDQRGLFYRNTGSFRLERLQDVNASVHGIIATFLNFGNLEAETASSDKNFVARGVPDPQGLKAIILEAADDATFRTKPEAVPSTPQAHTGASDGL